MHPLKQGYRNIKYMVKITIQKCMIWLPNETAVLKVVWSLNSNFNKDLNCTEKFKVCKILQAGLAAAYCDGIRSCYDGNWAPASIVLHETNECFQPSQQFWTQFKWEMK